MPKILYFTEGSVPTPEELSDIDKLNALRYETNVLDATGGIKYGDELKTCDFVSGSVPSEYSAKPTLSPDSTLQPAIPATSAVVANASSVTLLPATGTTPAQGSATAAVSNSVLTGVRLAATSTVIANAASVTLLPATGTTPAQGQATAAVASNAITGVRLPATSAVVTDGQTIAVTGGTVTITVVANVVTASFTAA